MTLLEHDEALGILWREFKGVNAVEMGRRLLERFGSLADLVKAPVAALQEEKGLKGAKAAQLIAAIELARRVALPARKRKLRLSGTTAVAEYLKTRFQGLADEQFRALYLNRVHGLLDDALIARGDVTCPCTFMAHRKWHNASTTTRLCGRRSSVGEPRGWFSRRNRR